MIINSQNTVISVFDQKKIEQRKSKEKLECERLFKQNKSVQNSNYFLPFDSAFVDKLLDGVKRTAEVTAKDCLIFFRLLLSNCLNWKIYCDDHSSLHLQPQYKYELFHIYFTSLHCTGKNELNKLTSLPMCGFIAQLVEHRTGIRGGHGFESR